MHERNCFVRTKGKVSDKKIILIVGPTAVGKTDYAIGVALEYKCSIISCDSRQLYRELEIGVAKPTKDQLETVEHHFINHVSIHQEYDAGKYAAEARNKINELFESNDTIVVCGGTGLYVKALLKGLDRLPERNPELRSVLEVHFQKEGITYLQERLKSTDFERYQTIDKENPQRLIRAIEIAENKNETVGMELPDFKFEFELKTTFLNTDREHLYERINSRVDRMIEDGLEEEARLLYPFRHLNALQTVGYSEWWPYFEGKELRENVIEKIKQHSRNYAKRQVTWFKNQEI